MRFPKVSRLLTCDGMLCGVIYYARRVPSFMQYTRHRAYGGRDEDSVCGRFYQVDDAAFPYRPPRPEADVPDTDYDVSLKQSTALRTGMQTMRYLKGFPESV